eukprot:10136366-Ditylum_brightwellii.AAC.1
MVELTVVLVYLIGKESHIFWGVMLGLLSEVFFKATSIELSVGDIIRSGGSILLPLSSSINSSPLLSSFNGRACYTLRLSVLLAKTKPATAIKSNANEMEKYILSSDVKYLD